MNPPGNPYSRAAAAAGPTPMPDMNDANIRQAQADALAGLLKRRGRSSTIFNHASGSGLIADQTSSPKIKAMVTRGV